MKIIAAIILPLVLQSYDEAAKQLADDLAKAETASGKVGVADEYVKLLNKFPKSRAAIIDAASDCYAKAWPDLDPVWKQKSRERLAKLYAPKIPGMAGALAQGWTGPVDPNQKASVSPERVHSGGLAAKLQPSPKAKNARLLFSPSVEVKPGKKVKFSLWVLSDGTESLDDHVRFYIDGQVGASPILKDYPIWKKLEFETEAGEGTIKANIEVVSFSKTGTIYVDDVSIEVDGKEALKGGGFEK
jgi:hypothetical protein